METERTERTNAETPLVSVIIPVYNVAAYLPQCLESVTGQTLTRIEILLVDDGSKDDSYAICRQWAERDGRIRCFHQENRGVSYARNLGIEEARGEYIAFIDSDDWVDARYLEKLLAALERSGGDFAECDLWRYDNRSGSKIYRACYGRMGVPYTFEEHLKYGPTASYKAMSRRSVWNKNGLRFPDCAFESPAVYALLVALCGRVESVREPLYYYRRFRAQSLIETGYAAKDGSANNTLGIEAMGELLRGFQKHGLYERYRDVLPGIVTYRLNDILAMQYHRKSPADFRETVDNFRAFLAKTFPDRKPIRYLTWGGYNLNRILCHMAQLHDPAGRFNFSSIISIAGELPDLPEMSHPNRYREMMLRREHAREFWKLLRREQPDALVMDLVEERFDLETCGPGFITRSDAYEGGRWPEGCVPPTGERIARDSGRCGLLWKESCARFAERLRAERPGIRVVIVENYLCEEVGTPTRRESFPNREEIRRTNALLRAYYSDLRAALPEADVVSPAGDDLYFTDEKYEYGAIPSHGNEMENQAIALRIEEIMTGWTETVRSAAEEDDYV